MNNKNNNFRILIIIILAILIICLIGIFINYINVKENIKSDRAETNIVEKENNLDDIEQTKKEFINETNAAVDAASQAMSLISIGAISGEELVSSVDYVKTDISEGTTYCFTVKKLVELGLLKKDVNEVSGDNPTYAGTVVVTVANNTNVYNYAIQIKKDNMYVNSTTGYINSVTDVLDYTANISLKTTCMP